MTINIAFAILFLRLRLAHFVTYSCSSSVFLTIKPSPTSTDKAAAVKMDVFTFSPVFGKTAAYSTFSIGLALASVSFSLEGVSSSWPGASPS